MGPPAHPNHNGWWGGDRGSPPAALVVRARAALVARPAVSCAKHRPGDDLPHGDCSSKGRATAVAPTHRPPYGGVGAHAVGRGDPWEIRSPLPPSWGVAPAGASSARESSQFGTRGSLLLPSPASPDGACVAPVAGRAAATTADRWRRAVRQGQPPAAAALRAPQHTPRGSLVRGAISGPAACGQTSLRTAANTWPRPVSGNKGGGGVGSPPMLCMHRASERDTKP